MLLLLLWACQPETFDPLNHAVFTFSDQIELSQNSAEWWIEEDERSNVIGGSGVLVNDLNLDGRLDLVLLRRNGVHVHLQQIDGWQKLSYTDVDFLASSGSVFDWDRDGDVDIWFNTVMGPDVVWTADEGNWSSVEMPSPTYTGGSAWYDVNQDGLLDLVTAGYGDDESEDFFTAVDGGQPYPGEHNWLYMQNPPDQPTESFDGLENFDGLERSGFAFQPIWLPFWGNDQWELLMINDFGHINGGHQLYTLDEGQFQSVPSGHGLDVEMYGMGVDATDMNGDLIPDLFITNIRESMLLESSSSGGWVQSALVNNLVLSEEQQICWGVDWYDVNNDGHEDLWVGCGPLVNAEPNSEFDTSSIQPDALFVWTENGYVDMAFEWGVSSLSNTRGGGIVDLNNDGCGELIRVPRDDKAQIFQGLCPEQNAWLDIELQDGNAGVGATIVVDDGEQQQVRWVRAGGSSIATFLPQVAHFGFGPARAPRVNIEVRWADGTVSEYRRIKTRQRVTLEKE